MGSLRDETHYPSAVDRMDTYCLQMELLKLQDKRNDA